MPYVVQRAAAAVFTESGMAEIQQNLDYYRQNAKVIADALDACGVWYCGGKNSPYIWLRCPGTAASSAPPALASVHAARATSA